MNEVEKTIKILLISSDSKDVEKIKKHLKADMRLPWNLANCINIQEALSRSDNADIIILDLSLEGLTQPKQIFKDVGNMVFEVPIIALTGKSEDEHKLATYVMEQGAADIVVRGKFGRLVDAIEFALIRQNITTTTRHSSDKDMQEEKKSRANEQESSRQVLRMFTGDYSVDKDKKEQQ